MSDRAINSTISKIDNHNYDTYIVRKVNSLGEHSSLESNSVELSIHNKGVHESFNYVTINQLLHVIYDNLDNCDFLDDDWQVLLQNISNVLHPKIKE